MYFIEIYDMVRLTFKNIHTAGVKCMTVNPTGKVTIWQMSSILRMIYKNPGIIRSELSKTLNMNKSIATQLTSFLEENGWIQCLDLQTKKQPLGIKPDRLYIAGVEIQPEYCGLVICNLEGKKVYEKNWKLESHDLSSYLNIVLPYNLLESGYSIGALGIALPGIVDSASHTLLASQPFRVTSPVILPEKIGTKDFPVFYDNDTRCIGWGLVSFKRENSNFYLHYMNLVEHDPPTDEFSRIIHGTALFLDQKAFEGSHHCTGEVRMQSHLAYTDGKQQFGDYVTRLKMKSNPDVFKKYLRSLSFDISYISALLDVDKVYIVGSLRNYKDELTKDFLEMIGQISYYPSLHKITIEFPEYTNDSMSLGAAGMAIERLFSIPSNENPSEFYKAVAEAKL